MENKFKDRDISFETLEKAVNGDYFAMQEVIRLFKPYMARLSIEEGRFNRELYERLVRKVMLITVRFKTDIQYNVIYCKPSQYMVVYI